MNINWRNAGIATGLVLATSLLIGSLCFIVGWDSRWTRMALSFPFAFLIGFRFPFVEFR